MELGHLVAEHEVVDPFAAGDLEDGIAQQREIREEPGSGGLVDLDGHTPPRPPPLSNSQLKAGRHRIRLENPRLKLSVTRQVNILPGKKLDLVVEMKK